MEVSSEGETVWEWYNPWPDNDSGKINVYRMIRVPKETVDNNPYFS
ncbi:hypothetical protein ISS07_06240 [Candidatus Woesearchaeota archaeon]|nr:hypothetical protein [Candidatus Woesearchaeota archaeon]